MRKKIMSLVVSFLVITGISVPTMSYAVENLTTNEEKTVDKVSNDNKTVNENEGTEGLTIENGVVTGYTGTDTDAVSYTHLFTASYAHRILFIKDGKIFTELVRGNDLRKEFFNRIMEVITMLGGDDNNVF